jgi:hypothetical protein
MLGVTVDLQGCGLEMLKSQSSTFGTSRRQSATFGMKRKLVAVCIVHSKEKKRNLKKREQKCGAKFKKTREICEKTFVLQICLLQVHTCRQV